MQPYFETKEAAEEYKRKHNICAMVPEYLPCFNQWALVFPIKAQIEHNE